FYHLLKPLTELESLLADDYRDWRHADETFKVEAGVGECAGVVIDLIQTLLLEAEEKLVHAFENYQGQSYADAIYHAYSAFVIGAKALLLAEDINPNTQINTIRDFDEHFVSKGLVKLDSSFEELVLQINQHEPDEAFAQHYLSASQSFIVLVQKVREQQKNLKTHV
ncbi:MAG: HEPN domain-containing protein, partial [Cyclobacteriaceae bacterium]